MNFSNGLVFHGDDRRLQLSLSLFKVFWIYITDSEMVRNIMIRRKHPMAINVNQEGLNLIFDINFTVLSRTIIIIKYNKLF